MSSSIATMTSANGPSATKRDKLSREVLELLSGGTVGGAAIDLPPIVPSFPGGHHGRTSRHVPGEASAIGGVSTTFTGPSSTATNNSNSKRTKWVWAAFGSSARQDGTLFHHWVKSHVEYPDYPYARFDIHLDPLVYTDDEYNLFCKNTEKDNEEGYAPWTKSETDILLNLCKVLELRWPVIYDRYRQLLEDNNHNVKLRTMEELQYRYYTISTALTNARVDVAIQEEIDDIASASNNNQFTTNITTTNAPSLGHVLSSSSSSIISSQMVKQAMKRRIVSNIATGASTREFTFQKERTRRYHLELLWNRSRKEEEEEAKLREELKMIEGQLRKLKKSGKHIIMAPEAANNAMTLAEGGGISSSLLVNAAEDTSSLIENTTTAFDSSFASSSSRLDGKPGVPYLQSSRLVLPAPAGGVLNKNLLKKLELTLQELNIPQRPIATKRVCDACDVARKSVLTLLTLEKIASQREKDVAVKQQRLVKAKNAALAAKARAAAATVAARDSSNIGGGVVAAAPLSSSFAAAASAVAVASTVGVVTSSGSKPVITVPSMPSMVAKPSSVVLTAAAAATAKPLTAVGVTMEGFVPKQAVAVASSVSKGKTVVEGGGGVPTNAATLATFGIKAKAVVPEGITTLVHTPNAASTGSKANTTMMKAVKINTTTATTTTTTAKSKKRAMSTSSNTEASIKRSAPPKEGLGDGAKGKKRKVISIPKVHLENFVMGSAKLPLMPTSSTSVITSNAVKIASAGGDNNSETTRAKPSPVPPQETVLLARPGVSTTPSDFTPPVPNASSSVKSGTSSAGSEDGKNYKKRIKKN